MVYLSRCGTLETTSFGFATVLRSNLMEAAGQAARTGVASKERGGGGSREDALQIVTHFQTRTVSARPSPDEQKRISQDSYECASAQHFAEAVPAHYRKFEVPAFRSRPAPLPLRRTLYIPPPKRRKQATNI